MRLSNDTYDDILRLQFERLGLESFRTKSLAVDEGSIGTLDVLDVDLHAAGSMVKLVGLFPTHSVPHNVPFHLPPKPLRVAY